MMQRTENPDAAPHYVPVANGPAGHNLTDIMQPFNRSIEEVLDHHTLGYQYDTETRNESFAMLAAPFIRRAIRSPFADS
jgi:hypothetical protein